MRARPPAVSAGLYVFGFVWGFVIIAPFLWLASISIKTRLDAFANPTKMIFSTTFDA